MIQSNISKNLLAWFQTHQRCLPWRKTRDPYAIWVSEVMLQQTQVNTVIPYYERFLKQFPDIISLANARQDNVLKSWEGLGYYARAINLHKASRIVVDSYSGHVPSNPKDFIQLPGVGDYINAAVQSIAFGHGLAVVDGNVRRVLARLYEMPETVNETRHANQFAQKASALMNQDCPGNFNQAIMELGALICRPRNPDCINCPLTMDCQAFKNQTISMFPKRKKKAAIPTENWVAAIIQKDNKILLTQRKSSGFLGGLWEFPGGKRNAEESCHDACLRHIKEQLQLTIIVQKHVTQIKHAYTHFKQKMDALLCEYESGTIDLNGPVDYKWIEWNDINQFALPKSNLKFLKKCAESIG